MGSAVFCLRKESGRGSGVLDNLNSWNILNKLKICGVLNLAILTPRA